MQTRADYLLAIVNAWKSTTSLTQRFPDGLYFEIGPDKGNPMRFATYQIIGQADEFNSGKSEHPGEFEIQFDFSQENDTKCYAAIEDIKKLIDGFVTQGFMAATKSLEDVHTLDERTADGTVSFTMNVTLNG